MSVPNFIPAIPELFVFAAGTLALLFHAIVGQRRAQFTYLFVQLIVVVTMVLLYRDLTATNAVTFSQLFIRDHVSVILKLFITVTVFFTFWYSSAYVKEREMPVGEYFILGLFSMLGMMVLVSAGHFLSLYLGLELTSLPIYAMVAIRRESRICTEAGIKYFIMGALASGMLLYGLSLLYGATGTLVTSEVAHVIAKSHLETNLVVLFGLVFVMVGIAFKLGAVPFHMWLPDVYEGAPTPVTLFIATATKIAALGLAIRLLIDTMPNLFQQWQQILIVVAILSMGLGNFVAIMQTNIKRMLGYSSIAHMGYMFLGLLAGTKLGYSSATFYMITYTLMTLGAFGLIILMSHAGMEAEKIDDFKGLNSRNPWLAFLMLIMMFSLAGVPPIVGFWAKLSVLNALIQVNMVWLAVLAVLFAIVGAYYYIRVVKVMYFDEPELAKPVVLNKDMTLALSANGLIVLGLGIFPAALYELCKAAF